MASPDGVSVYVALRAERQIAVVDVATASVVDRIDVPQGPPRFLTPTPDGRRLYASVFDDEGVVDPVLVEVDLVSGTAVATPIAGVGKPYRSAVLPAGGRLLVPDHDSGTVHVVDTATNEVVPPSITVKRNPHWVDLTVDGALAYTADHESDSVSVIETATGSVVDVIGVGRSPHSVAVNPVRPMVVTADYDAAAVSLIDTTTGQVGTIGVGEFPQAVYWAPDGRFAYVVNEQSETVSILDAETRTVTVEISTEESPTSMAVLPDGSRGYVTNLDDGTLTVLDLTGGA